MTPFDDAKEIDDRMRGFRDGHSQRICAFPNNRGYVRGWFEGHHLWRDELIAGICSRGTLRRGDESKYPWLPPAKPPWG
jgi:hypothetical protein